MTVANVPQRPTPGTDCARLLDALEAAYPGFVWNADSGLQMKANSRAADLRAAGFDVEWQSRPRPGSRKRDSGYRLRALPATSSPSPTGGVTTDVPASRIPHPVEAPAVDPFEPGEALSLFPPVPMEARAS